MDPAAVLYLPAAHEEQDEAAAAEYVPTGHEEQDEATAAEYVPTAHEEQADAAAEAYCPATQAIKNRAATSGRLTVVLDATTAFVVTVGRWAGTDVTVAGVRRISSAARAKLTSRKDTTRRIGRRHVAR